MPGIIRLWKWLTLALWIVLGVTMLTLLIAAIQSKSLKNCKGMEIEMLGEQRKYFLNKQEITSLLTSKGTMTVQGKSLKDFDLKKMEEKLEALPWIKNAELYFTNKQVLKVEVEERTPVARIFTSTGNSFYIDSELTKLPLSEKFSSRVPVFTNFPSDKNKWKGKDSMLMNDVKNISHFISKDSFWAAQVEQVDITGQREFQLIPKVGDHIVIFGDGDDIDKKFKRLYIFYRDVMSKTGWNRYSAVNVQFKGQVVASRKDMKEVKADTLLARQWIKQMIQNSQQLMLEDTLNRAQQNYGAVKPVILTNPVTPPMKTPTSVENTNPGKSKQSGKQGTDPKEIPKPKAVMPPLENR
jgi:cell division protein FtsQ